MRPLDCLSAPMGAHFEPTVEPEAAIEPALEEAWARLTDRQRASVEDSFLLSDGGDLMGALNDHGRDGNEKLAREIAAVARHGIPAILKVLEQNEVLKFPALWRDHRDERLIQPGHS